MDIINIINDDDDEHITGVPNHHNIISTKLVFLFASLSL